MTKEEFKTLHIGDLVVSHDARGRARVMEKIGPTHYCQGYDEKELFSFFRYLDSKKIIIKRNNQIRNKIAFERR